MAEMPQGNVVYRQECFEERVLRAEIFGVADETETGGLDEQVEKAAWLIEFLTHPSYSRSAIIAITSRAALRVLPFVYHYKLNNYAKPYELLTKQLTFAFRATNMSLTMARYPDFAFLLRGEAFNIFESRSQKKINNSTPEERATRAALKAAEHTLMTALGRDEAYQTFQNCSLAAIYPPAAKDKINEYLWKATEQDILLIEDEISVKELTNKKLWHDVPPKFMQQLWGRLAATLSDEDHWHVWKNWYQDQIEGNNREEIYDLTFTDIPEEKWAEGPAAANLLILGNL